ncbi:SH3 domain-containing protein [Persephonella sp. KM09-Lau-8]|uniref:SH3 domain-containing protein n=1 Tax=Persephonella sp. KM09-Lau-8 TaxID=1158345 RepID=UPI000497D47E|nr:SH3 domain-containing protein [Persephonella sp. KM09-Lau-8]
MKKILLILFIITVALIDAYLAKELLLDPISRQFAHYKNQPKIVPEKKIQPQQDIIKEIIKKAEKENTLTKKTSENTPKSAKKTTVSTKNSSDLLLIAQEFTRMREKPDIKSKVIAIVRKGAIVRVIDQKGRYWKKIIYKSGGDIYEGWVDGRFFKPKESQ